MAFKEEIEVILRLIDQTKGPAKSVENNFKQIQKGMEGPLGYGKEVSKTLGKTMTDVAALSNTEKEALLTLNDKAMPMAINSMKEMGRTQTRLTQKMKDFGEVTAGDVDLLKKAYGPGMVTANQATNGMYRAHVQMGSAVNVNTRSHERFRMELLSVMFFGMALSKMFRGWIDNVLKMTGVTDLLSAVMTMFLLPVIVPLIEHIVKIATALMDLPAPIRGAVGAFMIFITIIGTAIFMFGQFALGYIGMKAAFPALAVALGGGIGAFLTFLGVLGLIAGAIVGFLAFMYLLIFDAIPGFFRAWDVVREMIREDIPYLNMFVEAIECIYNAFMKLLSLDIGGFFDEMGKALGKGIGGTVELIGSALPSFQHGGIVPGSGPVPIMAHGGETILPAGMSGINYSPTYNISANISGGMDVDSLLDEIHSRDIANLRRHLIR